MSPAAGRHVLMTADAVGGVWTYALDLAEGLLQRGQRVTLAVLGPAPSPLQRRQAAALAGLDLFETGLPLDWAGEATPEALAVAGHRLAALATRLGADIVHLNSPILAAGGAFQVPVVGACHSCLATWWDQVKGGAMPEAFVWRTTLLSEGYRAADALLAPSRAFARATEARYSLPVRAIPNGRAPRHAPPSRRRTVALASGRLWDEGKGLALLDLAAGRMRHPVEAAGMVQGPNGAAIALRHVVPLGQLGSDGLAERLAGSAVYVSTALYEPFGLGVLEAAQAGCALVLSDIPTFRELWDGAALFVDASDAAALATALDDLLSDLARTGLLGARAKARAAAYGPEPMIEETLRLHDEVLARASTRRVAAA